MKNITALLIALGLALPAMTWAQDADAPRPPRGERPPSRDGAPNNQRPPAPPLFAVLDANHDGAIDEDEIKNASEALKKLDKNSDGKITADELRPRGGERGNRGEDGRERPGPRPPRRNGPEQ
jgi:hypothetical protein